MKLVFPFIEIDEADYLEETTSPVSLSGPPCSACKYWKPRFIKTSRAVDQGFRYCWSGDMNFDFSCYTPEE